MTCGGEAGRAPSGGLRSCACSRTGWGRHHHHRGLKYVRVQDGFGMPIALALSIVDPIFKGKGGIRNCSCYGAVMPHEHGIKMVERVLEKTLCGIVTVNEMQFIFMSKKRIIDAMFILRRQQEEYHAKGKIL